MHTTLRRLVVLLIISLVPVSSCLALDGGSPKPSREFFPSNAAPVTQAFLPVDSILGQTASNDATEYHITLCKALKSSYSPEWVEAYIEQAVRSSLIRVFDSYLSRVLPVGEVLFSKAHENGDGSVSIGARIGDDVVEFVMSGGKVISIRKDEK